MGLGINHQVHVTGRLDDRPSFAIRHKTPLLQVVDILLGATDLRQNQHYAKPDASPAKPGIRLVHVMRRAGIKSLLRLPNDTIREQESSPSGIVSSDRRPPGVGWRRQPPLGAAPFTLGGRLGPGE